MTEDGLAELMGLIQFSIICQLTYEKGSLYNVNT